MNYELGVLFFKCLLNCAYRVKVFMYFWLLIEILLYIAKAFQKMRNICALKSVFFKKYIC